MRKNIREKEKRERIGEENKRETKDRNGKKDDNEWCLMMRLLRPRNSAQTSDRKLFNETYLTFLTTTPKVTIENNNNNSNKNYNNNNNSESETYWDQQQPFQQQKQ